MTVRTAIIGGRPLVSIVTPSFNHAPFIEATIRSVLEQDYPSVEYIVMDGGSTDGTLDILRKYDGKLRWVSQEDDGQSDAIHRGFAEARGAVLGWLNSDDLYLPGAITAAVKHLSGNPTLGFVYGRAQYIDRTGQVIGNHVRTDWNVERLISQTNYIPQPATFFTREAYDAVGGLDRGLHYCMDYDLWIRLGLKYPALRASGLWAQMRLYPEAKTAAGQLPRIHEIQRMIRRHGRSTLPVWLQWDFVRDSWRAGLTSARAGSWLQAVRYWGPAAPHLANPYVLASGARVAGRRVRRLQRWLIKRLASR
jgi:glycosyltransferase involved in cell wall biosynthesis